MSISVNRISPVVTALLVASVLWCVPNATAQEVSSKEVNYAIERGVDFLKSKQNADGSWVEHPGQEGGMTSLVLIALLSCEVPPEHPVVKNGIKYIKQFPPTKTYAAALQTMALAAADPEKNIVQIRRNAQWLMQTRLANGGWGYGMGGPASGDDESNTQYALLGLQAAKEAGVEIPEDFWQACQRYWIDRQNKQAGSWGYRSDSASGSMTSAGISSLVIAGREQQQVQKGSYKGEAVRCAGVKEDKYIRAAADWLGRNFTVQTNPGAGSNIWHFYYLYGLERAGRLSGRRKFGDADWYRAGARYLARSQLDDGGWTTQRIDVSYRVFNTAFGLLFLSKGKIPILVNKFQHGRGDDWNNAPNDVNNLTKFVSDKWKVKLNWQIVTAKNPTDTVQDLMQAPVLQMSGHAPLSLSPKEKKLLREFVEQGGLIVADANCSIGDFDESFRALCKEIFPEPGQELKRIEEGHGVWTSLFQIPAKWPLFGIDIGCRTAVFYSPQDLSCRWEHHHEPDSLLAMRVGANIIAYAVGPEDIQEKLDERKIFKSTDDPIRRGYLQLAKLKHNGDWNPAPRAVRNLMSSLREMIKVDVVQQSRDLDFGDPNITNYPLVYMHGRTRFTVAAKDRETLVEHLKSGGVLFADACCGSEKFDGAFRQLIQQMFPDKKLEPIPNDHALLTTDTGYDLSQVDFGAALQNRRGPPILEGIQHEGRFIVIYSKYDLGCAMERQKSTDCRGYTHESALKIATNIALYALKQ